MPKRKAVSIQLAEYLSDQEPQALKGLVSAPIAYRADRLIHVLKGARPLGDVGPGELVSALLHATKPDLRDLRKVIETYREARVWETRVSLGEVTETEGIWRVRLRGPGERWG